MLDLNELSPFGLDVGFGYLDRTLRAPRRFHPKLVLNTANDSVLRALREELKRCVSFTFSVAFVSPRAIALLKQEFADFDGVGTIITSDYLGFNSPEAFRELYNLKARFGFDVRLHAKSAFHPKGYVFERADGITAILGSSNLTESALVRNHEWNLKISADRDSDLAEQFTNLIDQELTDSAPLTLEWIADYTRQYRAPDNSLHPPRGAHAVRAASEGLQPGANATDIFANSMQIDALARIEEMRASGETKSLVISATGTGKTILSALDVKQFNPRRMLFIAHREQILDRAIQDFGRVLGESGEAFGKFAGGEKVLDRRFLFATIQSLTQPGALSQFEPATFDYILIDEVHRAGADSYTKVIDYFTPSFLLGMTATPERNDGVNIFELFDYKVPYEIRLSAALELDMLTPFHYYGITDVTFEDGHETTEFTPLFRLISPQRVDHVIQAIETYGHAGVPPRGLIFCSRNEEARELSAALNKRRLRGRELRTIALSGTDSIEARELAVERLESGDLDYLVTVDIFNEGVDIPTLNQVIMLRQTQSSTVFVQQLGRGLRKAPGKEYLIVIDFIGNYTNNYLIPIALFGDDSLNLESLRKNLIGAEEIGVIAGLSSVRFDRIAQERILNSLASTKLDSFHRLRSAIEIIRNRVGRIPVLMDFLRFESVDPVLLATKLRNYPALLRKVLGHDSGLSGEQLDTLSILSREVFSAKRAHELTLLKLLLHEPEQTLATIATAFTDAGLPSYRRYVDSAIRTLTLEFNTQPERDQYGPAPVEVLTPTSIRLAQNIVDWQKGDAVFRQNVDDLIETGLSLIAERFDKAEPFTPARQYSRKDASRLLCWPSNMSSTIYGYKTDRPTSSCAIFVTHHKAIDVEASTAYADELLDPSTMLWFSRSRRTMESAELRPIIENEVDLHVFGKKDDAEGAEFYYLGRARADAPEQTTMPGKGGIALNVVKMYLRFEKPIEAALYDYFKPTILTADR